MTGREDWRKGWRIGGRDGGRGEFYGRGDVRIFQDKNYIFWARTGVRLWSSCLCINYVLNTKWNLDWILEQIFFKKEIIGKTGKVQIKSGV